MLGAVRLGCNCDYDKLQNLAEEHRSLRRIMGIGTLRMTTIPYLRLGLASYSGQSMPASSPRDVGQDQ